MTIYYYSPIQATSDVAETPSIPTDLYIPAGSPYVENDPRAVLSFQQIVLEQGAMANVSGHLTVDTLVMQMGANAVFVGETFIQQVQMAPQSTLMAATNPVSGCRNDNGQIVFFGDPAGFVQRNASTAD